MRIKGAVFHGVGVLQIFSLVITTTTPIGLDSIRGVAGNVKSDS